MRGSNTGDRDACPACPANRQCSLPYFTAFFCLFLFWFFCIFLYKNVLLVVIIFSGR